VTGRHGIAVAAGAAAVAGGLLAYGALVERNAFTVRRETVALLPPGSPTLRILHLSDLHLAPWQEHRIDWLRSLAELEPDLVVDTGDNLGHRDAVPAVARALEVFEGVPGVYVHGSNDYFAPKLKSWFTYFSGPSKQHREPEHLDTAALEAVYDGLGWVGLNNRAALLPVGDRLIEFVGLDDPHLRRDRLDLVPSALEALREGDDEGPETLSIGVVHAPYVRALDSLTTNGSQLILAGHTHGGQVCAPGFGALVTNCDLPRSMARGMHVWTHAQRAAYLNVSAGVGTSIYAPVRFACPPEAIVIDLVPRID